MRKTGDLWHRFKLDLCTHELTEIQDITDHAFKSATELIVRQQAGQSEAAEAVPE